jgi:peptidoglycan/LPS O-acetylase OafA/YrhL
MTTSLQRRTDIDIARAVAIFTIVLHHIPQYFVRYDFDYFPPELASNIISTVSFVNVPTFMLIAGIVLGFSYPRIRSLKNYWQFEYRKLCRLMLPFIAVSLMQLTIKVMLFGDTKLQIPAQLIAMVLTPIKGPAPHLWFLYVLMTIFLIWPLFGKLTTTKLIPFLWAAFFVIAVLPVQWPNYFKINGLIGYLPIFTLGYWYSTSSLNRRHYGWPAVIIAGILVVSARLGCHVIPRTEGYCWAVLYNAVRLSGSTCGALFVFWLCGIVCQLNNRISKALATAGLYSYDIYLLHVALIAHPLMLILSRTVHPGIFMTWVLFIITSLITMIAPIFIGKMIRLLPPLAFVMLGVPIKRKV